MVLLAMILGCASFWLLVVAAVGKIGRLVGPGVMCGVAAVATFMFGTMGS